MKINAINMLRQSVNAIDPKRDRGSYAYMLEQLAEHLEDVREGRHTWEEFAEFYCLTDRDRVAPVGEG
jgi:hypothetical protein